MRGKYIFRNRELKKRGLYAYTMSKMIQVAERPSMREWLEQTQRSKPARPRVSAAKIIRELRESR
jgi:hypothetical protein